MEYPRDMELIKETWSDFLTPHQQYKIIPGQRERSPDYQKLYSRGIRIWDTRRGQPNRSAMERPRPGGTAFMITVNPWAR